MKGWPPTVPGAAIGGKTKASAALVLSLWTMQAPEAPRLAADGRVTAMAKYMATAASAALPPASRISRPISAARLSSAATAAKVEPPSATTRDRPPCPATGRRDWRPGRRVRFRCPSHFCHKLPARTGRQRQAADRRCAIDAAAAAFIACPETVPPVFKRIITLFCLALLALAPLGAARAQQGQRLNLIRDAEIENTIRTAHRADLAGGRPRSQRRSRS